MANKAQQCRGHTQHRQNNSTHWHASWSVRRHKQQEKRERARERGGGWGEGNIVVTLFFFPQFFRLVGRFSGVSQSRILSWGGSTPKTRPHYFVPKYRKSASSVPPRPPNPQRSHTMPESKEWHRMQQAILAPNTASSQRRLSRSSHQIQAKASKTRENHTHDTEALALPSEQSAQHILLYDAICYKKKNQTQADIIS